MTTITIRDVPPEARDALAARARSSGRSLQEFLRAELIDLSRRPDMGELADRIRSRKESTRTSVTPEQILREVTADRR
ncbi:hypothetical protein G7072_13825 [Nocardioides sp. HDW12B]|uniref:FitA-like ribbon-helix-helix domain-containing protein n=1 Tax=Nocardioides sp. HDW12B TaxID=2714939 RepID=UPI001409D216|nr:hypothetical protein [Nocardioides sp. HDW12B]QIK67283.1 hypothetical protein G7072_13825 [Nocardioides sp. HDW12B]